MNQLPPKWADKFLEWYCHPDLLEDLQGDLHEIFKIKYEQNSKSAKIGFIWLVLRSFRWANINGSKFLKINTLDMYRNYLKIAWRSLIRSKLYSTINISGLAVGMAVFMLISSM